MIAAISAPAVAMLVGAFGYGFAANPKLAELARLLFLAGAIALCFVLSREVARL